MARTRRRDGAPRPVRPAGCGVGRGRSRSGMASSSRGAPTPSPSTRCSSLPGGPTRSGTNKAGRPEPFTDLLAGKAIVPAVKKRHGDVNLLQVAISGSRLACYINDQEVCSLQDREDMGGRIGLSLDRGAEVKFERQLITALPPVRPAARPVLPPVTPARFPDR